MHGVWGWVSSCHNLSGIIVYGTRSIYSSLACQLFSLLLFTHLSQNRSVHFFPLTSFVLSKKKFGYTELWLVKVACTRLCPKTGLAPHFSHAPARLKVPTRAKEKKNWKLFKPPLAFSAKHHHEPASTPSSSHPHTSVHYIPAAGSRLHYQFKMTMEIVKSKKVEEEHTIKPQAVTPAVDTSSWPLLLKNYDKRE